VLYKKPGTALYSHVIVVRLQGTGFIQEYQNITDHLQPCIYAQSHQYSECLQPPRLQRLVFAEQKQTEVKQQATLLELLSYSFTIYFVHLQGWDVRVTEHSNKYNNLLPSVNLSIKKTLYTIKSTRKDLIYLVS